MLSPTTSRHLSFGEEPFASASDKVVMLTRPVNLTMSLTEPSNDMARVLFAKSINGIPSTLPARTKIVFDTFIVSKDYACFVPTRIRYLAWFYVPSLRLPKDVRFEYIWGRGLYLNRAPWEDETVPARRYVGFDGKGYDKD